VHLLKGLVKAIQVVLALLPYVQSKTGLSFSKFTFAKGSDDKPGSTVMFLQSIILSDSQKGHGCSYPVDDTAQWT